MHPAPRQIANRLGRFSCVFLASLVTVAQLSRAQAFNTIYSFSGPNGRNPYAGLTIAPGGALYGTTMLGGTGCAGNNGVGCGTAVYLTPPAQGGAWSETVLYSFGSRAGDTIEPDSTLALTPGGTLFGTSMTGGANGTGTVFELAAPGGVWTEHVIHSFAGYPGYAAGASPLGVVASPTGVLYGTAEVGGANGAGLVFELAPPAAAGEAWTYTVLYNFTAQSGDGYAPYGPPILSPNGTLFGTTIYGGTGPCALDPTVTGCGTVFELSPPAPPGAAWSETVLYSFTGQDGDGVNPVGSLVADSSGAIYGATQAGGASPNCPTSRSSLPGCGTVFQLAPPQAPGGDWSEAVLYNFTGAPNDGASPWAGIGAIGANGAVYGTTLYGGNPCKNRFQGLPAGCGTVFEIAPPEIPGAPWTETILYAFSQVGRAFPSGANPWAPVVLGANGALYGVTAAGGPNGANGTVFEITLP